MPSHIRSHYAWNHTFLPQEQPIATRHWSYSGDFPRHDHDFFEINLMLSGKARHVSAAGEASIQKGDIVILRPGSWHAYADCKKLEGVFCAFSETLLCHDLAWTLEYPTLADLFWKKHPTGVIPLHLSNRRFAACQAYFLNLTTMRPSPTSFPRRLSSLLLLFAEMAETLTESTPTPHPTPVQIHPAIHRAVRKMEVDLSHGWTTEGLAHEFNLETSYFGRIFRRVTGFTPMNFLENRRLERAATLLRSSRLSVGEIGEAVGLLNHAYFSHRFKKRWHLSPSDYRQDRAVS
jgi:AraC family transcriptional regulator, L-rhamnose operon transcriptional activator RhaR